MEKSASLGSCLEFNIIYDCLISGSILFAGVFAYYLVRVLEATGVTNLVRPASSKDYAELDQK